MWSIICTKDNQISPNKIPALGIDHIDMACILWICIICETHPASGRLENSCVIAMLRHQGRKRIILRHPNIYNMPATDKNWCANANARKVGGRIRKLRCLENWKWLNKSLGPSATSPANSDLPQTHRLNRRIGNIPPQMRNLFSEVGGANNITLGPRLFYDRFRNAVNGGINEGAIIALCAAFAI